MECHQMKPQHREFSYVHSFINSSIQSEFLINSIQKIHITIFCYLNSCPLLMEVSLVFETFKLFKRL